MLTRRHALIAATALVARPARAQAFTAPQALVDAARKEGRMTLYTASFTEVEQETIAAFNKRFPFIRIEMVRASGGQLITRVRTEAAAGKLVADVVDHSDRALMKAIEDLFLDYQPPNADAYLPGQPRVGQDLAAHHPGLVHRLQHRADQDAAQDLDGPDEARCISPARSAR